MTETPKTNAPKHDLDPAAITARAYTLYVKRGMKPGHDLDDWLEAERQLRAEALGTKVAAVAAKSASPPPAAAPAKAAPPPKAPAAKKKAPRKRR